ncbi:unnamed protein product [Triticum turgidum subsp. durum]|uniref:Nitrogen regulatory protein P-II n=1 Tax=Triticum turgidum subsp. durum TaxID=4567 RepID=A0A9R0USU1_TRITD|nr:unnamed protein product [Triticum turgidum subsp. durum]
MAPTTPCSSHVPHLSGADSTCAKGSWFVVVSVSDGAYLTDFATELPHFEALQLKNTTFFGYLPDSEFYKIEAILRPWRVSHVSSGLLEMGIRGVTVSDVRGYGAQGGSTERYEGSEFSEDTFIAKVKMEIVVCKEQVEPVIDKIIEKARTGEIGDGKIFLIPVADVVRVRTGERGVHAERMIGGLSDKLPPVITIS